MKMKAHNKLFVAALASLVLLLPRCSKKLEEQPYTTFTVDYFKTPSGFQNGIYALYSGMRFLYGPEGAVNIGCAGTDEWSMGGEVRRQVGSDLYRLCDYTLDNTSGAILTPWNRSFNNINLANGLVENAGELNISEDLRKSSLGEIHFLRGLYYFNLVQYFGAVPLDLGSGELKFNQKPFQGFNRLPTAELLVKNYQTIIEDFIIATQNLPDKRPVNPASNEPINFKVSKAVAFHMLSKAYIHRAYSAAKQASDWQNAYNAAVEVLNNQAKYNVQLLPNFADVHRPNNDYNKEILLAIERIPGNFSANEVGDPPNTIGGGKGVDAANDFVGDYTSVRSPTVASGTKPVNTRTVQYGRPIRRLCPTPWLYNVLFADKVNDSRYEGSFRTVYIASVTGGGFTANVDTGFVMALTNRIADSLNGISPAGPRLKPYRVIAPREFYFVGGSVDQSDVVTANMYPSLSKYEDPNKGLANNPGSRPFPVAKLSETYLMAAEAALALNRPGEAQALINVLKERAAFRPGLSPAEITSRYNAIRVNDPGQVTLDFILDERSRELCGESTRWPDLAARGKLVERVKLYNTDAAANIKAGKHELRPIPVDQLDRITDPDKTKYQNPGY